MVSEALHGTFEQRCSLVLNQHSERGAVRVVPHQGRSCVVRVQQLEKRGRLCVWTGEMKRQGEPQGGQSAARVRPEPRPEPGRHLVVGRSGCGDSNLFEDDTPDVRCQPKDSKFKPEHEAKEHVTV